LSEALFLILFHIECLDNPIPGDGLMEKSGDEAVPLLPLPGKFSYLLSKFFNRNDTQRKDDEGNDGQFPTLIEGNTDQKDDGKTIFEKTCDGIGDRSLNEVDIIRDPGDEDAGGCFSEKGEGKGLEMIVKFLPDIRDNLQTHKIHQVSLAVIKNTFQEKEEDDGRGEQKEHLHILLEEQIFEMKLDDNIHHEGWNLHLLVKNTVENRFNKERLDGCKAGETDHTDHGEA
jgi:hypothetical protein